VEAAAGSPRYDSGFGSSLFSVERCNEFAANHVRAMAGGAQERVYGAARTPFPRHSAPATAHPAAAGSSRGAASAIPAIISKRYRRLFAHQHQGKSPEHQAADQDARCEDRAPWKALPCGVASRDCPAGRSRTTVPPMCMPIPLIDASERRRTSPRSC
jgi:hypothetical protein